MRRILLALFSSLIVTGCGNESYQPAVQYDESAALVDSDRSSPYLAYEHWLGVSVDEENISAQYERVVAACAADRDNECTVLDAQISSGEYASSSIRMRILPAGVDGLAAVASENASVIERRTHVEDLEKSITDVDARISMLTATRDKLLAIESRAADDVDSLIKVAAELSRVQSELERLLGQSAADHQRVTKHILTVRLMTAESSSFFAPAMEAFSQFGDNLSEGIGDTVTAVAYLLPWSFVLFLFVFIVRRIWRRGKSK
ncbi:MAG: DUF4349 domain-containing protein [Woeseia sp.]